MKAKKLVADILAVCLIFGGFLSNGVVSQAAMSDPGNTISPRWVTVQKAEAKLTLSGSKASCGIDVAGYSNVSKISGTLKLILIKDNGSIESVQSWYLTGGSNLREIKTATVSSSGIYQLSFDGTATTKDGKTENITASDTKVY